jgi:hypothetical protein
MKERDAFFRELFGRDPTREEAQRLDRMGSLMNMKSGDTMWHVILINEFYEDRLNRRLAEIDRVAENAAEKALARISEAVYQKSEELAVRKNRGFMWRSWGFAQSMTLMLCVIALNAGYVMGSDKIPFWIRPENGVERILSWFFNVPSGWIIALGTGPFLGEVLWESIEKLSFGIERNIALPILKAAGAALALIFLLFVVLGGLT